MMLMNQMLIMMMLMMLRRVVVWLSTLAGSDRESQARWRAESLWHAIAMASRGGAPPTRRGAAARARGPGVDVKIKMHNYIYIIIYI